MAISSGLIPKGLPGGNVQGRAPASEPLVASAHRLTPKLPFEKKHGMAFRKKNKRLAYVPPEKQ